MFHCDKCDKDYKTSITLKKHSCKLPVENNCKYCDKLLSSKHSLYRHFTICKEKLLFEEKEKIEKEEREKEEREKEEREKIEKDKIEKYRNFIRIDGNNEKEAMKNFIRRLRMYPRLADEMLRNFEKNENNIIQKNENNESNDDKKYYYEKNKKNTIPKKIRDMLWIKTFGENQYGYCRICDEKFTYITFVAAHNISRANGGSDNISNLVCLCSGCNSAMGPNNLEDYVDRFLKIN